jgi:hypothetical protein
MSIEKTTCYLVKCEGHEGWPYLEDEDENPIHFDNEEEALAYARDEGWTTDGKIHHCESCSKNRPLTDPDAVVEPKPIPVIPGQVNLLEGASDA